MHNGNMKITTPHPSQSKPLNWPLLRDRWVNFYHTESVKIVCMGSPFVYWPSTASVLISSLLLLFRKLDQRHSFLLVGWIFSFFPFLLIPRSMYLYHYIIPLIFAVMLMVTMIETFFPKKISFFLLISLILVAGYGYYYFSPLVYGFYCPDCLKTKVWDERWLNGPKDEFVDDEIANITVLYGTLPT